MSIYVVVTMMVYVVVVVLIDSLYAVATLTVTVSGFTVMIKMVSGYTSVPTMVGGHTNFCILSLLWRSAAMLPYRACQSVSIKKKTRQCWSYRCVSTGIVN